MLKNRGDCSWGHGDVEEGRQLSDFTIGWRRTGRLEVGPVWWGG